MKQFLEKMFERANGLNKKNIFSSLGSQSEAVFLDLGCDDGRKTMEMAQSIGTRQVYGIEINTARAAEARQKGMRVESADLNGRFPFGDDFFDIIHANQVIEHICDLDPFVGEIYRVLKPGGKVVISTENGSSWHNIFAAVMGWQTFSGAAISAKRMGIGNPLALHRGADSSFLPWVGWMHKVIFNYLGLKEFFQLYDFKNIGISGAGYYPLPASLGRIDPRHAHFITLKANK